jgi:malate dehydrogenase
MREKVSVIGAGNVGATVAQLIAMQALADVVLYDIVEGMPQGKALDMLEATPLWGVDVSIKGTNSLEDTRGSSVVVITAGIARKPGMSRDDLLAKNAEVVSQVSKELARHCPEAIIIVVTNPMDAMAWLSWRVTGFSSERVMGMGGVLDSARFRTFVAEKLGVSVQDTEAMVLGGHGDQMVPMPEFTTVRGVPITKLLPPEDIEALVERTRFGGGEIVKLLKTASAYYAPAASTVQMVRAILRDEKKLLPAAAYLNGQYCFKDIYLGVPVVLGRNGIEKVVELPLTSEQRQGLENSASAVKGLIEKLKEMGY